MRSPEQSPRDFAPNQPGPSEQEVRKELHRVFASPHLQASDRRRLFLRYIVEETLAGRAERLKGYTIAVEVFGRDETFDPKTDPVVRLEARRLRRDLDSYYVDAGSRDPVRITIPKGSYVPHFGRQDTAPPSSEDPRVETGDSEEAPATNEATFPSISARIVGRHPLAVLFTTIAAAFVAVVTVAWFILANEGASGTRTAVGEPAIVVLPFEPLSSTENSRYIAEGITQELIGDLMRFPGFRLYTLPVKFGVGPDPIPPKLVEELGAAYFVKGSVREDDSGVRISAQLLDAESGQVLWLQDYNRPSAAEALIRMESDLAAEIASAIGQPYGIVQENLNQRAATPVAVNMQSYVCVLRAYAYRRSFSREDFDPVLRCLEEAVKRNPNYADAWAMLGWLHLDAGRFEYGGKVGYYDEALAAASQAVALEADNPLALKSLAAIQHYAGNYEESERLARRAVELNPHDPDALAQLGWRLAVRGNFAEGIPVLKQAIDRTLNPPGWYYHLVTIDLYRKGDYAEMLQMAERSAVNGSGVSQALIAIANAELGDREAAQEALGRMSAFGPLERDPEGFLRGHGATDEIVDALMAGLRKAGWSDTP